MMLVSALLNAEKIPPLLDSQSSGKSLRSHLVWGPRDGTRSGHVDEAAHLPPIETVRRLRPILRREEITFRPLRVAMRARKPWVRTRLTLWGW